MTVFAATSNAGKLRDFRVAAESGLTVQALPGLEEMAAPEETELTFEGNARLKAAYYSRAAGGNALLVLADDSGLEVDALDGAPGVRSARFAQDAGYGPGLSTDDRNNRYLLERMEGLTLRTARYRCVLAVARGGVVLATAQGSVEGEVLTAPRGSGGFGYDPLLFLPELERTMAEISLEDKHGLSHRGRAVRALLPELMRLTR